LGVLVSLFRWLGVLVSGYFFAFVSISWVSLFRLLSWVSLFRCCFVLVSVSVVGCPCFGSLFRGPLVGCPCFALLGVLVSWFFALLGVLVSCRWVSLFRCFSVSVVGCPCFGSGFGGWVSLFRAVVSVVGCPCFAFSLGFGGWVSLFRFVSSLFVSLFRGVLVSVASRVCLP